MGATSVLRGIMLHNQLLLTSILLYTVSTVSYDYLRVVLIREICFSTYSVHTCMDSGCAVMESRKLRATVH